jgi:hypothetical protein
MWRLALLALAVTTAVAPAAAQDFEGTLQPGDSTLTSGEYADSYLLTVTAGDNIVVDLTSGDFDPYLILRSPAGEQWDNDDWESSLSHSRIEMKATVAGTWQVTVTSYRPGETGAYAIDMVVSR